MHIFTNKGYHTIKFHFRQCLILKKFSHRKFTQIFPVNIHMIRQNFFRRHPCLIDAVDHFGHFLCTPYILCGNKQQFMHTAWDHEYISRELPDTLLQQAFVQNGRSTIEPPGVRQHIQRHILPGTRQRHRPALFFLQTCAIFVQLY